MLGQDAFYLFRSRQTYKLSFGIERDWEKEKGEQGIKECMGRSKSEGLEQELMNNHKSMIKNHNRSLQGPMDLKEDFPESILGMGT